MLRSRSLAPAALAVLAACASPVVLTVEQPRPAQSPDSIQLLLDAPERPFRTVALIRSSQLNVLRNLEALKREVRRAGADVGADAVIIWLSSHDGSDASGVTADGQVVIGTGGSSGVRIIGRAIVFDGV